MPIRFCSAASLREGAGLSVRQRFLLVLISAVVIKSITPPTFLESFRFVVNLLLLLHHPLSCFCFRRNGMSQSSPPNSFGSFRFSCKAPAVIALSSWLLLFFGERYESITPRSPAMSLDERSKPESTGHFAFLITLPPALTFRISSARL